MPDVPTQITSGELTATVNYLGAELQALTMADGSPLLWHGDAAFWTGRAPVLFPIVGRAPGDLLVIAGRQVTMAQHGFARRRMFDLVAAETDACSHLLSADDDTRSVYPFDFRLRVTHRLQGPVLRVEAEVTNAGDGVMPFQFGFHPAFLWPLPGATGVHRITLDSGADPALARFRGGLLPPERAVSPFRDGRLALGRHLFDADAMVFPEGAGPGLVYGADSGPQLHFRFENLPNLALWSKPDAPFLCIEPWHGLPATTAGDPDMLARPHVMTLGPGAMMRFAYTLRVVAQPMRSDA